MVVVVVHIGPHLLIVLLLLRMVLLVMLGMTDVAAVAAAAAVVGQDRTDADRHRGEIDLVAAQVVVQKRGVVGVAAGWQIGLDQVHAVRCVVAAGVGRAATAAWRCRRRRASVTGGAVHHQHLIGVADVELIDGGVESLVLVAAGCGSVPMGVAVLIVVLLVLGRVSSTALS